VGQGLHQALRDGVEAKVVLAELSCAIWLCAKTTDAAWEECNCTIQALSSPGQAE
jgi:hypothetical protein